MTAQIIKLSDHRKPKDHSYGIFTPYVASIGLWEAYLEVMQAFWQGTETK